MLAALRRADRGTLAGTVLGLIALIAIAVALLVGGVTSYRVLAAVWLWALPVLGIFAAGGWLTGRAIGAAASRRARS